MMAKQHFFARLTDYRNPNSYGSRLRTARFSRVTALIEEAYAVTGSCRILDVGGTEQYWSIADRDHLRRHKVTITLLNLSQVELQDRSGLFFSEAGDACRMPQFERGSFDLVHSNSVIEHVGLWGATQSMANEVRRIGRAYYLQTPYYWFPIEPHYFGIMLHWLPFPWRVKLQMRMRLGYSPKATSVGAAVRAQQGAQLLDVAMMRALFPDAVLHRERWFGLTKSLVVVRHRAAWQETKDAVER